MMNRNSLTQRLFQVTAWMLLGFSFVAIVTGFIVGPSKPSLAQENNTTVTNNSSNTPNNTAAARGGDSAGGEGTGKDGSTAATTARGDDPKPKDGDEKKGGDNKATEGDGKDDAKGDKAVKKKQISLRKVGQGSTSGILDKAVSFLGIFALLGLALLMSNNRRKVNWRLVAMGVGLQLIFALFIFYFPGGKWVFSLATDAIKKLLAFTDVGSEFIFSSFLTGEWEPALRNFTFGVLPTIIFFSALMTVLYHLGVMQLIVRAVAFVMQKTMRTSGAETLSAAANIFVGQTEAPLVIKPYINEMTRSELMTVMTGGFATVAGGVLAIYVKMLEPTFPDIAGHLLAASVMSAPAALVIGKIIYPETETPVTAGALEFEEEKIDVNVLDAASRGAAEGLKLALNVGAMLLAFIALIELVNFMISYPSLLWNRGVLEELNAFFLEHKMTIPDGCAWASGVKDKAVHSCVESMAAVKGAPDVTILPMITLQKICGYLFWPIAWVMGVPAADCYTIAQLLGTKLVVNELVAYAELSTILSNPAGHGLQDRSIIIVTYALCGFANFGSIGIQLGGIGGIAPDRKHDLAEIAVKAMLGGTLAAFMTGTIAGILI